MTAWQTVVHPLIQQGRIDEALAALEDYLLTHGDDAEALAQAGRLHLHLKQPKLAEDCLMRAIAAVPGASGLHYELGVVFLTQSAWPQAMECFGKAIALQPDHADGHYNLAWVLRKTGQPSLAETHLRHALSARPHWPAALFNLGNLLLQDLDRPDDAKAAYAQALLHAPGNPDILCNMALACWQSGDGAAAESLLRQALATHPTHAQSLEILGNVLTTQGRVDEAVALLRRAESAAPDNPSIRVNLALALRQGGRSGEALALLRQASAKAPNHAETWNTLGAVLLGLERLDEAHSALTRAVELSPDFADAHNNLGNLACQMGREEQALDCYRQALALAPLDMRIHSNLLFLLTHRRPPGDAETVGEHLRFGLIHEERVAPLSLPRPNLQPGRVLRIGFVSPDFRNHAVSFWIESILERMDQSRFELFCYACSPIQDHVTDRLRGLVPHWRNIYGLPPLNAALSIRDDRIDILVDLAGHSANNALAVFLYKPAPIQATMIGYPATTGLTRIDYRVSDIFSDPRSQARHAHSETLELLEAAPSFRPSVDAPEPGPLPALTTGFIRYGSVNKPQKITPEVVETWARILKRVPNAKLTMVLPDGDSDNQQQRFRDQFVELGIDPGRIDIVPTCPLEQFLEILRGIDVTLDTFPYGGGTTTMFSLWMGAPMVTLDMQASTGSVATGMLASCLLHQFITTSPDHYVDIAVELATNFPALDDVRQVLRDRVKAVLRSEEDRFIAELETMFQRWWDSFSLRQQADQPPQVPQQTSPS